MALAVSLEDLIVSELNVVQGQAVDIGGYYRPDREKTAQAIDLV